MTQSTQQCATMKEEEDEDFFILRKPVAGCPEKPTETVPPKLQDSQPSLTESSNLIPASTSATAIVAAAIQAVAGGIPNLNSEVANRLVAPSLPLVPQLCIPLPAFTVSLPPNSNNNPINPEMKFIVLPVYQCWGCRKEFTDVGQFHEHVNKLMCLPSVISENGGSLQTAQPSSDTSTSPSDNMDVSPNADKVSPSDFSRKKEGEVQDKQNTGQSSIDSVIESVLRKIREENIKKEADCEVKMEVTDTNEESYYSIRNDSNNNNHTETTPDDVDSLRKDTASPLSNKNAKPNVSSSEVKSDPINNEQIDLKAPKKLHLIVSSQVVKDGTSSTSDASQTINGLRIKEEMSADGCSLKLPGESVDPPSDLQIVDPMETHAEHPARLTKAIYSCVDCTAQFHTNIGLLRHQSAVHGAQQFPCDISGCSKVFKNESALSDHKKRVHGPRSFACVHCNAFFTTETYLKAHVKIHMDKKHVCRECSHGFVNKTDLNNHMRVHTGVKPYTCKVCGKAFRHVSGYYTHVRIHTGETPYECEFCHKKFTNASNFQTHRKIHTQDKKFKCETCGKEFIQQSNFTRHKRTHTKERPYECSECGESFSYSTCLKKHLKKDHGVEPLECDQCKRTFLNNSSFVRHRTGCQFKDIVKKEAETDSAQFL